MLLTTSECKTVAIRASSCCEVLRNDLAKLQAYFIVNGWNHVSQVEDADLIILSGCGYSQERENSFFELLGSIVRKASSRQQVVVYGCIAKIASDRVKEVHHGSSFGPREGEALDRFVGAQIPLYEMWACGLIDAPVDTCYVSVGIGCAGNCTYCAIRKSRGAIQSLPIDTVVSRFRQGINDGFQKFVLIGDDIGCYGIDIGVTICDLMEALLQIDQGYQVRLHYFDPRWFVSYTEELLRLFRDNRFVSVLIPLQSGSPRILDLMNRFSKPYHVMRTVTELRAINPYLELHCHVMSGFPTETLEDWNLTVATAKAFDTVVAGVYSERPGTVAAHYEPKVIRQEALRRVFALGADLPEFSEITSAFPDPNRPADVKIFYRTSRLLPWSYNS